MRFLAVAAVAAACVAACSLRKRKARNADAVAAAAIEAAKSQRTVVPGQQLAAAMVARLAEEVMTLDTEIGDTDAMIEERFRRHRHAEIILSMPGFGVILGAEFLAATGGDIAAFGNTDRLAAIAGLAPVPT
jgi:transposase